LANTLYLSQWVLTIMPTPTKGGKMKNSYVIGFFNFWELFKTM